MFALVDLRTARFVVIKVLSISNSINSGSLQCRLYLTVYVTCLIFRHSAFHKVLSHRALLSDRSWSTTCSSCLLSDSLSMGLCLILWAHRFACFCSWIATVVFSRHSSIRCRIGTRFTSHLCSSIVICSQKFFFRSTLASLHYVIGVVPHSQHLLLGLSQMLFLSLCRFLKSLHSSWLHLGVTHTMRTSMPCKQMLSCLVGRNLLTSLRGLVWGGPLGFVLLLHCFLLGGWWSQSLLLTCASGI